MINSKMSLWDTVGLKPFAQTLPEQCNLDPSGYTVECLAIGNIDGVKIAFVGYVHKTGDTQDGSLAITYNFSTGLVIGYSTTNSGNMNSAGFNPNDNNFYVTPGGNWNNIVVYDKDCHIVKNIPNDVSDEYKAGGITFNRTSGNAYVAWYSDNGSDATIKINEVEHIENYNLLNSDMYKRTHSWNRGDTASIGRQDIYCDDMYIYFPTYWHKNSDLNWGVYNKQDVFSISTLEYVQTQYIDMNYEINGGEYFDGKYYITVSTINSGLICLASVIRNNGNNSAYEKLANMHAFSFNYGPVIIYADADHFSFFADGTASRPFARLRMLNIALYPFSRNEGIEIRMSGDFTHNGKIISFSVRNCINELTLIGVQATTLPKFTFTQCNKIRLNNVTFKTFDSDYCLYIVRTKLCMLEDVKFENGNQDNTINSVLRIDNSLVIVTDGNNASEVPYHIGFDGTTPRYYLRTMNGGRALGNMYRDYDTTGSGTYITMQEFSFDSVTNDSVSIIGCMTDNGLNISGNISFTDDFSANDIVAGLPSDNKQLLYSLVQPRGTYYFLNGVNSDGENVRLKYVYETNKIVAMDAITSGDTVYVSGLIPLDKVTV